MIVSKMFGTETSTFCALPKLELSELELPKLEPQRFVLCRQGCNASPQLRAFAHPALALRCPRPHALEPRKVPHAIQNRRSR